MLVLVYVLIILAKHFLLDKRLARTLSIVNEILLSY